MSVFKPDLYLKRFALLDVNELVKRNIRLLLVDFDNTIVPLGSPYIGAKEASKIRELKEAGTDMQTVALNLCGGGVRTVSSSGRVLESRTISAEEVAQALEQSNVRLYYSDRYESAYCIYPHAGYQTVTLWYQSEVSLAAKLKLARLFGVEQYALY